MSSTTINSASVRFRTFDGGLVEVHYLGVLSRHSYSQVRLQTIAAITGAPVAVIRYDKAVIVSGLNMDVPDSAKATPPGAVIVLPEQMRAWADYAAHLARAGVMRAVFLVSEEAQAYRWARAVAACHRPHCPRASNVDSDFAALG